MGKPNLQTRTGNKIIAVLDGKTIGLIQSVEMNDDYSPEPASGIGDIHVQEYVPTMARHTLSVSTMVLNRGSMGAAGVAAENGDAMLKGLVFDIEVYGKEDGALLRKYTSVSYASGSISVQKHSIVVQSGQFQALDVVSTAV